MFSLDTCSVVLFRCGAARDSHSDGGPSPHASGELATGTGLTVELLPEPIGFANQVNRKSDEADYAANVLDPIGGKSSLLLDHNHFPPTT
jgi:hypothetical protein